MNLSTLTRLLAAPITAITVSACASIRPELTTLYKTENALAEQPPVILIHGAFGGRLCDSNTREHWPGSLLNLLLSDYRTLAVTTPRPRSSSVNCARRLAAPRSLNAPVC